MNEPNIFAIAVCVVTVLIVLWADTRRRNERLKRRLKLYKTTRKRRRPAWRAHPVKIRYFTTERDAARNAARFDVMALDARAERYREN